MPAQNTQPSFTSGFHWFNSKPNSRQGQESGFPYHHTGNRDEKDALKGGIAAWQATNVPVQN
jgi:hypothetical protein